MKIRRKRRLTLFSCLAQQSNIPSCFYTAHQVTAVVEAVGGIDSLESFRKLLCSGGSSFVSLCGLESSL